jgi:hypothetical protein
MLVRLHCISRTVPPLPRADAGTLRSATAWRLASICASSPWTFAFTSAKSRSISDWLPETIASDHCIIHHVSTRSTRARRRRRRHRLGSRWRGCPLDVGTRGRGSGRKTWHPPERALLYCTSLGPPRQRCELPCYLPRCAQRARRSNRCRRRVRQGWEAREDVVGLVGQGRRRRGSQRKLQQAERLLRLAAPLPPLPCLPLPWPPPPLTAQASPASAANTRTRTRTRRTLSTRCGHRGRLGSRRPLDCH